jgi:ABC-type multidrug transport system fused ATPase/permease subunit
LDVWRWTVEYLNAPRLLRIFNSTDFARKSIDAAWQLQLGPERRADLIYSFVPKALEIITVAGAGTFLIVMFLITSNQKEAVISTLFVYVLVFFRLRPVLKSFSDFRAKLARIVPRLEVVGDLLMIGRGQNIGKRGGKDPVFKSRIDFRDVSFSYPGSETFALKNLNLLVNKGETIALVGGSGAGKSTLADLLLGLFSPSHGSILVDDIDLETIDQEKWRDLIGVVDQEAFLLNTSIRDNMAFARSDVSDQELEKVAIEAHADEFICNLENGYDTIIGDRGLRLSGGQQQRVVLARALLRNPEILILDEATSALDTESERLIQRTLDDLHNDRTIVIIAHRLSTVVRADKIIVIEDGEIIEQGSPTDLIEAKGRFSSLWRLQHDFS